MCYAFIPHNFLVIKVCNQGKTLCSPCILLLAVLLLWCLTLIPCTPAVRVPQHSIFPRMKLHNSFPSLCTLQICISKCVQIVHTLAFCVSNEQCKITVHHECKCIDKDTLSGQFCSLKKYVSLLVARLMHVHQCNKSKKEIIYINCFNM